jgi:hypothetical protein
MKTFELTSEFRLYAVSKRKVFETRVFPNSRVHANTFCNMSGNDHGLIS